MRKRVVESGAKEIMVARPLGLLSGLGSIVNDQET